MYEEGDDFPFNPKRLSTNQGSGWYRGKRTSKTIKYNDLPKGKQKIVDIPEELPRKWTKPKPEVQEPRPVQAIPTPSPIETKPGVSKSKLKRLKKRAEKESEVGDNENH